MPSKLDHALELAGMGFYVFPLEVRSKLPAIDGYPKRASRDPEQIRAWWTCPVTGGLLDRNIGISTTSFAEDAALLVVDVDNKDGKRGDDTLLLMDIQGFELPPTLEALTPTGGRHLYYVVERPVKQNAGKLGRGVDVRSRGGYVVGPGSETDRGVYRWS